jgi:hypothetical protein
MTLTKKLLFTHSITLWHEKNAEYVNSDSKKWNKDYCVNNVVI